MKRKRHVWLVARVDYDMYDVIGIFTSEKRAKKAQARAQAQQSVNALLWGNVVIDRYEVNKELA